MFSLLRVYVAASLILGAIAPAASAGDQQSAWRALKSGTAFALMRHALAPGLGDPSDFRIGDCSTQRNLSEDGRQQARAVGAALRAKEITTARVLSSQWCRCLDTAEQLGLGPVEELSALNSLHGRREHAASQTEAVKAWLRSSTAGEPIILVTHQANISALTGRGAGSGEVIIAQLSPDGSVEVLSRLSPD